MILRSSDICTSGVFPGVSLRDFSKDVIMLSVHQCQDGP